MSPTPMQLWYDSFQVLPTLVVPILKQTNTAELQPSGTDPFTLTLPNSYTTVAEDCIIVAAALAGGTSFTVTGCGATWTSVTVNTAPIYAIAVGVGCSAGGTTISITRGTTNTNGDLVVGIWSGIATSSPIRASVTGTATATNITSPSLSYSGGDLVIGMAGYSAGGAAGQWGAGQPAVWSDTHSNTNVFRSQNGTVTSRPVTMDYQLPGSNSSTTLTETLASGSSNGMGIVVAAIKHG